MADLHAKTRGYRDLIVWQKAMDLVPDVYRLTKRLPREELYGLSSQIQRAAVSVPANIAEGQGSGSSKLFVRYLCIARASLAELDTLLDETGDGRSETGDGLTAARAPRPPDSRLPTPDSRRGSPRWRCPANDGGSQTATGLAPKPIGRCCLISRLPTPDSHLFWNTPPSQRIMLVAQPICI